MFSTSSCGFATRFRPAFDFLSKTWSRTAAGSLVRARARQMECRKNRFKQVRSWLSTCLRPGFRPGLQLARIMECAAYTMQERGKLSGRGKVRGNMSRGNVSFPISAPSFPFPHLLPPTLPNGIREHRKLPSGIEPPPPMILEHCKNSINTNLWTKHLWVSAKFDTKN